MKYLSKYENYLLNRKNYSRHTCNAYLSDLRAFFSFINEKNLDIKDVDYNILRYYIVSLSASNYAKSSIKRILSSLNSYFMYLIENNILKENPLKLIESLKADKKLPEHLYLEEVVQLFKACDKSKYPSRDKLVVGLLFLTGVRVSELVNIKLQDLKGNVIKVLGKGNKERYILLTKNLLKIYYKYLENERNLKNTNCDYLLINSRGTQLTDRGVRYILDQICKKSTLSKNVYPHLLRHSFATHFLSSSNDLRAVQTFLGHENLSTTQVYTHLSDKQLLDAYRKFNPRAKKTE